jgi:hypothetical protein
MYYALLIIGGINTVISTVYYLKILKVMVLERPLEEVEGRPAIPLKLSIGTAIYGLFLGLLIFVGGVAWNPMAIASDRGIQDFASVINPEEKPVTPSGRGRPQRAQPAGAGAPGAGGQRRPPFRGPAAPLPEGRP